MTLRLVPPGQRKNNPYWLVYGRWRGRVIERSTRTTEEAAARRFLRRYELELNTRAAAGIPAETLDRTDELAAVRAAMARLPPLTRRPAGNVIAFRPTKK